MTLREMLEQSAQTHGGRVALRFKADGAWQTQTYAQLFARVRQVAELLGSLGLRTGDRVAILLPNIPQWPEIHFGITSLGLVAVPLDAKLRGPEVAFILRDSGARAIFCSATAVPLLQGFPAELSELECAILLGAHAVPPATARPIRWRLYAEALAPLSPANIGAYAQYQPQPDDLAVLLYTSGTTGQPKGAMLTHANFTSNITAMCRTVKVFPSDNFLLVLPLHHAFAFSTCLGVPIYIGAAISFIENPKTIGDDLRATAPTALVGVPLLLEIMYRRMLEGLRANTLGWILFKLGLRRLVAHAIRAHLGGRLRLFVTGGAPCDAELLHGFARLGLEILEGYGLTETAPVLALNPQHRSKPGTVGVALPGVELRLFDISAEGVGEIAARGPNIMSGYFNNAEATAAAFRDGWFLTGDLGRVDAEGYLTITGRKKCLIVTREGKNISPEEVESQVLKSPLLKEVLVLSYREPAERVGEHIGLIAVPTDEAWAQSDAERCIRADIIARLRDLADFKHPRRIVLRRAEFEKTSTGKIKRFLYTLPAS